MKKILLLIMFIFMISFVNAQDLEFKENEPVLINIPCVNDGSECTINATCEITVFSPNGGLFVDAQNMSNNGNYFNYSIPPPHVIGLFSSSVYCVDGSNSGHTDFTYEILNKQGVFNLNSCPSTLPHMLLFMFIFVVSIGLIVGGMVFRSVGMALIGSFIMLLWSFLFVGCNWIMGVIMIAVSLLLIIVLFVALRD